MLPHSQVLTGQTSASAEAGYATFSTLRPRAIPGTYHAALTAVTPTGRRLGPLLLQLAIRECIAGEVEAVDRTRCIPCGAFSFSLDPRNKVGKSRELPLLTLLWT